MPNRNITVTVVYTADTPNTPYYPGRPSAPEEDIPEEDTPLAEAPEEQVPEEDAPLTSLPEEEVTDEEIPLVDAPKTGNAVQHWGLITLNCLRWPSFDLAWQKAETFL